MSPYLRTLAAVLCFAFLAACPKSPEPQEKLERVRPGRDPRASEPKLTAEPAPLDPAARPAAPLPMPGRPPVPTAIEAELALSMGVAMFEQAKFLEAEEQLKIASAGGKSEADALLLRARAEMEAKSRLSAARKALAANDLATAELELSAIPGESVLREMADELRGQIESTRERMSQAFQEKALEALKAELKKDGEDAGEEAPEGDDAPAPEEEKAE